MQNAANTAGEVVGVITKVSGSPYFRLISDSVQNSNGLKFLAGPLGVDLFHKYKNYSEQNNKIRNLIHGVIIVVAAVVSIVFSQISPEFRDFLATFATSLSLSNDSSDLTDAYYAYVGYMFSTYVASISTKIVFDVGFLCEYGDEEFHLSKNQALAIASQIKQQLQNEDFPDEQLAEIVQDYFKQKREQLRQGHCTVGATEEDLRKLLLGLQCKSPVEALTICKAHNNAMKASLEELKADPKENLNQLFKYMSNLGTPDCLLQKIARTVSIESDPRPSSRFMGGSVLGIDMVS